MFYRRIIAATLSSALLFAGLFAEVLHSHSSCDSSKTVGHSHLHANGSGCSFHQCEDTEQSKSTPTSPCSDDHGCSICVLLANSWNSSSAYAVTIDEVDASELYLFPATIQIDPQPLFVPIPRGPPVS